MRAESRKWAADACNAKHFGRNGRACGRPSRNSRDAARGDALSLRAGDELGSEDGERRLVNDVGLSGNGGSVTGVGSETTAAQEDVLKAADEGVAGPKDGE